MFLIVKNTYSCNLNCEYCSTPNSQEGKDLTVDEVTDIWKSERPANMLLIGGEVMMKEPEYYLELLDSGVKFSIQSNATLYSSSWNKVLRHKNFEGISLSGDKFHHTERFLEVYNQIKEITNPMVLILLISQEDVENYILAKKWVDIAIENNMTLKLNHLLPSGRSKEHNVVSYYRTLNKLLDEYNTLENIQPFKDIGDYFIKGSSTCPHSNCSTGISGIRCRELNGDIFNCGVLGDLKVHKEDLKTELEPECFSCKYYRLCRGCFIRSYLVANDKNYCKETYKLFSRIERSIKDEADNIFETNGEL